MICHTIKEILNHAAEAYGGEDAVRYKAGKHEIASKSYAQLLEDSERISGVLKELGPQGMHVALTGMTSYLWIASYFGIVGSGDVAVPLDASLPAAELCELIDRSDAEVFLYDELRRDAAELAREKCPKLRYILPMQPGAGSLPEAMESARRYSVQADPDALCTIMFTSGTTGKSKGVMLTQRNLAENATCLDMKLPSRAVTLSVLPIHHAYCLGMDILKALSLGTVICINDSLMRVAKNIKLFQPDIMLMVPMMIETMGRKLKDAGNLPAEAVRREVFGENLHTIFSGGAYLNPEWIDLFKTYGVTIQQGYGMTECSPVISTNLAWAIRKESVGQLMPNCEAKTVDGELWVRGSSVMQGYYKMPKETADTLEEGWLKTGDLGYVDEDGYVYLTGRKKNLIILKNGENVSPEELENHLSTHRLVKEVLVREKDGVIQAEIYPDFEYAQENGISDIREELQKLVDAWNLSVPSYKKIVSLAVRETEFEKTPSKKIKRY